MCVIKYVWYTLDTNKWALRPELQDLQPFNTNVFSVTWTPEQNSEDAELSIGGIICSFTIGCRKCSPQLQTLKPNESNIMSLTCHWLKPRKDAVGSVPLLLLKLCLQFLLFCCWRHINRLLDTAFSNKSFLGAFPIISRVPDKISSFIIHLPKVKQVIKIRNIKTFSDLEVKLISVAMVYICSFFFPLNLSVTLDECRHDQPHVAGEKEDPEKEWRDFSRSEHFFWSGKINRLTLNVNDNFW